MRRFLLPAGLVLLTACTQTPGLPSEQVMEKTLLAAQDLQSAAFSAAVEMDGDSAGRTMELDATLKGRTQDAGRELALSVDMDMTTSDGGEDPRTVAVSGDIAVLGGGETYLRLRSVDGDDPTFMNPLLAGMLNQWWALPVTGSGAPASPDPRLLRLQAEVLVVKKDHGIEKVAGRDAYHYDVGVDKAKLLAFLQEVSSQRGDEPQPGQIAALDELSIEGEAWIDAETFHVLRLLWTIGRTAPALSLKIDSSFSDHNAAEPVSPPEGARPFPADAAQLMMFMPGAGQQLPPPAGGEELPPEVQEEILRSILENR